MDSNTKKRYEELKRKQKEKNENKLKYDNSLLMECLELLKNNSYILNDSEEQYILKKFNKEVPITEWGRISWEKMSDYKIVYDYNELLEILIRSEYYIIWGKGLPIIKCDLNQIIKYIYDIIAVDFDTWLVSSDFVDVVEFCHRGQASVGKL